MKKLLLIGVTLIAALTLSSCGKKDETTPKPTIQKFVKQIVVQLQNGEQPPVDKQTITYKYDTKNRLVECNDVQNGEKIVVKYTYAADKVVRSLTYGQSPEEITTFSIGSDGLITQAVSSVDPTFTYIYTDGRLKSANSDVRLISYAWTGNNLTMIGQVATADGRPIATDTLKYTDHANNTNISQLVAVVDIDSDTWSGLLGRNSQNLIAEVNRDNGQTIKYTYQFDADNCPVSIVTRDVAGNTKYIYAITY